MFHISNTHLISQVKYWLLIMFLLLLCNTVEAKKPDVKSEVAQTTISGYVQAQFKTTNDDDEESKSTFKINHGRLQIKSELTKALSTMIEIDAVTDHVDADDVYLKYEISQAFSLKAGQMKKPFSIAQLESSSKAIMIDSSFSNQDDFEDYTGRDIGLIAELDIRKRLDIAFGIFNGAGSGADAVTDDDNTKDFVGRIEFEPIECLKMAFNTSSHGLTNDDDVSKRKYAYGADISVNRGGFRMIAEALFGDRPKFNADEKMRGLYITAAYKQNLENQKVSAIKYGEIGGRIESIDSDRTSDNDAVTSITPYIGVYFDSNANLKFCPVMRFPQQGDMIIEFTIQAQTGF